MDEFEIRKACHDAYGYAWQATLAQHLNVSRRQVRRWFGNGGRLPEGMVYQIGVRMVEHADKVRAIGEGLQ